MATMTAIQRSTGRDRQEWFALLDRWGAGGRPYREIANWLTEKHGVSRWWAQKLIVEYEQERGIRPPGVRRDGSFEVGTSKTISAPIEVLYRAFMDGRVRKGWLSDGSMTVRTSQELRSIRFDWTVDGTRVNVSFEDKGPSKTSVSVTHAKLPSQKKAAAVKAQWKERLNDLKAYLEA